MADVLIEGTEAASALLENIEVQGHAAKSGVVSEWEFDRDFYVNAVDDDDSDDDDRFDDDVDENFKELEDEEDKDDEEDDDFDDDTFDDDDDF